MAFERPAVSRRALLKAAAAAPLASQSLRILEILPGLRILEGAVNTALFERKGKTLLIDCGELAAAPSGNPVEWVLFTHHHRDQASAAARLCAACGAKTMVPAREAGLFADAHEFWDSVDRILYHRYNFRPHLFTLREPVPVTRAVKEGDTLEWEGLRFEVIDTPGHTDGSVSYLVECQGKRVAFTGDLICGQGKIRDIYSLQKPLPGARDAYVGFGGAVEEIKTSLDRVLERKPDLLIPSHGVVMEDPSLAVAELKENLDAIMENFLKTASCRIAHPEFYPKNLPPMLPPLEPKAVPTWFRNISYTTKAIVADDKSVFVTDCGGQGVVSKLAQMMAAREIGPVENIWITHYHDDHTEGINLAKRRFGAKVYVQRELVDIIEHPTAYNMPCLFPESIHVDRVMDEGETIQWKEFRLTAYHFPGQTLYHAGLLVERDGFKLFVSGDSFSNWGIDDYCSENRNFLGPDVGYEKCLKLLLKLKPNLMVSAHERPGLDLAWLHAEPSDEHLRKTIAMLEARRRLYRKLLPYDDANFGTDPFWIRAYPYRQNVLPGGRVEIEVRITNHSTKPLGARVRLCLPEGWTEDHSDRKAEIPARSEGRIRLSALAPRAAARRRHVIGIAASVDGKPLGEFAEALVETLG